jgi:hypothetical protein
MGAGGAIFCGGGLVRGGVAGMAGMVFTAGRGENFFAGGTGWLTVLVADHSCGTVSSLSLGTVLQPAKNKNIPPKMIAANLNTRQLCGTRKRTQADSGKRESSSSGTILLNHETHEPHENIPKRRGLFPPLKFSKPHSPVGVCRLPEVHPQDLSGFRVFGVFRG